jgi:NADH-quinone oxidoreductase subunit J
MSADFGQPAQIGELLLTKFLFAFELASFLLLVAAVGAVVLARRRRGLDAPDEPGPPTGLTARELAQIPKVGSFAEAAGTSVPEGGAELGKGGW